MGMLVEGQWTTEWYQPDEQGRFVRNPTVYRNRVTADGSSGHPAEAGRYHLYVSLACPWAHRTLIMRKLKGLEDAISLSVVNPLMGDDGWTFEPGEGVVPDAVHGAKLLREVYLKANSKYTGRVTVPILWDKQAETIVNNESRDIMRMFDHEFQAIAKNKTDYCPPDLQRQVDDTLDALYEPINNGVYRSGFATTQEAYDEAVVDLFRALDHWNEVLGKQRYLCGDRLTEADISLFTTLYRFDPVYYVHFKCNIRRIADFPNLSRFVKELYNVPGVAETCNMDHIKRHYYQSHRHLNPTGIVPRGPIDL